MEYLESFSKMVTEKTIKPLVYGKTSNVVTLSVCTLCAGGLFFTYKMYSRKLEAEESQRNQDRLDRQVFQSERTAMLDRLLEYQQIIETANQFISPDRIEAFKKKVKAIQRMHDIIMDRNINVEAEPVRISQIEHVPGSVRT